MKLPSELGKLYVILKTTVDKVLQNNGYGIVNLSALFQGLFMKDPDPTPRGN